MKVRAKAILPGSAFRHALALGEGRGNLLVCSEDRKGVQDWVWNVEKEEEVNFKSLINAGQGSRRQGRLDSPFQAFRNNGRVSATTKPVTTGFLGNLKMRKEGQGQSPAVEQEDEKDTYYVPEHCSLVGGGGGGEECVNYRCDRCKEEYELDELHLFCKASNGTIGGRIAFEPLLNRQGGGNNKESSYTSCQKCGKGWIVDWSSRHENLHLQDHNYAGREWRSECTSCRSQYVTLPLRIRTIDAKATIPTSHMPCEHCRQKTCSMH